MPLLDHFRPPLSVSHPWMGFHSTWATAMAQQLNRDVLPADYYAIPNVELGGQVEIDLFEVQVLREFGGPQLRAAIELISPANKDRPSTRRAFAVKCASYLQRGVSVMIIDVVTERSANLHAEFLELLKLAQEAVWTSPTKLYTVAYRTALSNGQARLEIWTESLSVAAVLPTMPLWLDVDLCLPFHLEESHMATCESLRIRI